MDLSCHECGEPQSVWMVARCTNPSKAVTCGESFCFKCLGQMYPQLYGSIFKGFWWLCPACTGICKCETCSDPVSAFVFFECLILCVYTCLLHQVKKAEYQRLSKRKLKQRPKPVPVEDTKPLKLRSGTIHNKHSRVPELSSVPLEDPADGWICSRCSIVNSLDDIECIACCCHRKRYALNHPFPFNVQNSHIICRNTRKRYQEPVHEGKIRNCFVVGCYLT